MFEINLNKILYKLFSKNSFNYFFVLLLIALFIIILYNHNNLIEGNLVNSINNRAKKNIKMTSEENKKKNNSISKMNNKGNNLIYKMKESFIEGMNCSKNNYFNVDKNNTASKLVSNACLQSKKLKQENNV